MCITYFATQNHNLKCTRVLDSRKHFAIKMHNVRYFKMVQNTESVFQYFLI